MTKRGRKAHVIPSVFWRIGIRKDIADKVELLLTDPVLGSIEYGARGKIITELLTKWLAEQGVKL